jgi:hypothetical protein
MDIRNISRAADLMREAQSVLGSGPLDFYLCELAASYNLLMERFAPFKVGDRVALSRTPNITSETAPGWMSCRHFLVKGATGTVKEANCGQGGFRFGIVFDDDSWIDRNGKKQPTTSPGMFMFAEDALSRFAAKESSTL